MGPNSESSTQDGTHTGTQNGTQNLQEMHQKIITMIQQNNKITRKDMARELVIGTRTLQRVLNEMGNIRYVGSGYSGHWEIQ